MAYKCPRCGDPVQRGNSNTAQMSAGLVGALFYAAFGALQCTKCGKLKRSEFPAEDRSKMLVGSLALIGVAIALAVGVILLIANMN